MELRILKPSFKYTAGQWLFLQVPEISHFQWHPVCIPLPSPLPPLISFQFTITSAPEDPYVSVHIRQVGDWTNALGERLGCGPSVVAAMSNTAIKGIRIPGYFVALDPSRPLPQVRIDGPYGTPAEDVFDNEAAVLIGGGIGVSPFTLPYLT